MKIFSVRFAENAPIPTPGRTKDHTKEIQSNALRSVELRAVDGVAFVEVRVPGQRVVLVPMDNVVGIELEEKASDTKPDPKAKVAEVHEGRHSTGAPEKK